MNKIDEMLIEAVEDADLDDISAALKMGADINVNNDAALQVASSAGHIEIVKLLINSGSVINIEMIMDAIDNCYLPVSVELVHRAVDELYESLDGEMRKHIDQLLDFDFKKMAEILGSSSAIKLILANETEEEVTLKVK